MTKFLHTGDAVINVAAVASVYPGGTDYTSRVTLIGGDQLLVVVKFAEFVDALQGAQESPYHVVTLPEALKEAQK